jgi:polyisoprenoid-binding protein YceI
MFKTIIVAVSVILVVILGFVVYSTLKPPAEASAPITALPIQVDPTTTSPQPATTDPAPAATDSGATQSTGSGMVIYQIVPADSQVSFTINEVLRNSPNTVVGTTDQVAGQISFDPSQPADAQVGPIQVDARTLVTDNNFRNRTLKNQILDTNNNEYITFAPTSISGLPDQVTFGTSYNFKITGDLTIKGVTKPVSFDATVTPVDATKLQGSATTTILYKDYGISIPQIPSVASVDDSVILKISFVAVAG